MNPSAKRRGVFIAVFLISLIIAGFDWVKIYCSDEPCPCPTEGGSSNVTIATNLVSLDKLKHKTTIEQVTKAKGVSYLDPISLTRYYDCLPSKTAKMLNEKSQETRCHKQRTFLEKPSSVVALVSFQGSGNTWVRHLLEQATGVYTGSVYCDTTLKAVFPGEHVCSGNVLAVKTHHPDSISLPKDMGQYLKKNNFDKAIVIVRNPFDALVSEANRRWNKRYKIERHLGLAKESTFIGKVISFIFLIRNIFKGNPKWDWFVEYKAMSWLVLLNTWLKESSIPHIVVQYERLKVNVTQELVRILEFIDMLPSNDILHCVNENSEGMFKRPEHLHFDPYSKENKNAVNRIIEQSKHILSKYNIYYGMR